ncbi:MAG: DUF1826 domain-containing protein [Pseudomonadota bacterium]
MNTANEQMTAAALHMESHTDHQRFPAVDSQCTVLADIYKDDINIAIWQRTLSDNIYVDANALVEQGIQLQTQLSRQHAAEELGAVFALETAAALRHDVAELVEMFCCLFGLERAGLRLISLYDAMCPAFHFDRIPCRLVTTYCGMATEWLTHESTVSAPAFADVDLDMSYERVSFNDAAIQSLQEGDVAILKGSGWQGNERAGLVHRSPPVRADESRLLLTLDIV